MHLQYSSIWFSSSEQEKNVISGHVSRNVLFPPYHFICFTKPLSSWELFDVLNWTFAWRFIIPRGNSKQITHFIPMAIFIKLYFKSIFLKFSENGNANMAILLYQLNYWKSTLYLIGNAPWFIIKNWGTTTN